MANFFDYGPETVVFPVTEDYVDSCKIGLEKVLFSARNTIDGSGDGVRLRVGIKNGDVFTFGTEVSFSNDSTDFVSDQRLGYCQDDKALCVYVDSLDSVILARVITVSGTTITANTETVISTDATVNITTQQTIHLVELSAGVFLLQYTKASTNAIVGRRLSVSGTTISVGNELSILSNSNRVFHVFQVSSDKACILYRTSATSTEIKGAILSSITSSSISVGSALTIDSNTDIYPKLGVNWYENDLVIFRGHDANNRMALSGVSVSGSTLSNHTATYASYHGLQNDLTGRDAAIVLNNKGVAHFALEHPFSGSALFEFDYNTTTDAASMASYELITNTDSNLLHTSMSKLSESLGVVLYSYPGAHVYARWISSYFAYTYFWGSWQDGMLPTYLGYSTAFSRVLLGTHVANDVIMLLGTYPYESWSDITYNLIDLTYNIYPTTWSYIFTYGATYAAVRYMNSYTNVRGIGFI